MINYSELIYIKELSDYSKEELEEIGRRLPHPFVSCMEIFLGKKLSEVMNDKLEYKYIFNSIINKNNIRITIKDGWMIDSNNLKIIKKSIFINQTFNKIL